MARGHEVTHSSEMACHEVTAGGHFSGMVTARVTTRRHGHGMSSQLGHDHGKRSQHEFTFRHGQGTSSLLAHVHGTRTYD
jgi:hypothetical protein